LCTWRIISRQEMIFVRREGLPVEDLAVSRISSQKKNHPDFACKTTKQL